MITKTNMLKDTVTPFLKWVGGKRQLLKKFRDYYPNELLEGKTVDYCEPFLGGGAVYFDLINNFSLGKVFLNDINTDLINVYQVVKEDIDELISQLKKLEDEYISLNEDKRKEFYYSVRENFNQNSDTKTELVKRAIQFIFLNRTCYNGLYRLNSKGKFNVPAGRYKNPTITNEPNLRKLNALFLNVQFTNKNFIFLRKFTSEKKTFFYFDPPYRPLSSTANFTNYNQHVFTDENQHQLYEIFKYLDKQDHLVMLSNSDPKNSDPGDDFFDTLYKDYNIYRVPARRMVNSNPHKRGEINEIIVTNYPVKL